MARGGGMTFRREIRRREIRRHATYCSKSSCLALVLADGFGPGARRATGRPSRRSSPETNSAVPTGRPVPSARRVR
jgi:hypothetical protein